MQCDFISTTGFGKGLGVSEEKLTIGIEHALQTLAQADQILDGVTSPEGDDEDDEMAPWQVAHVWIFRAMCLLIDSLDGVETVTFSSKESIPVANTTQPYTYLSERYVAISDRYKDLAQNHESLAREMASLDDDD